MTKRFIPIWLVVLLLVVACGSDKHQLALLDSAETVMTTAPDTALALLDSIDSDRLSRADNARYALLRSQALDKNYIDVTNDSLINIAVEYYQKHHNPRYEMLAHYYHGRVMYNDIDFSSAVVSFMKSEKTALHLGDNFQLGQIYHNISDIYHSIYWGEGSIEFARKSYEAYAQTDNHNYTHFALLNWAISLYNYGNYTESQELINKVLTLSQHNNDTILYCDAQKILGNIYWAKDDFTNAIYTYKGLFDLEHIELPAVYYTRLSTCYTCIGNYQEAYKYAHKAYELDSLQTWGLYLLSNYQNNYKEALDYLKNELTLQNNILDDITTQSVIKSVEDFRVLEEELRQKAQERTYTIIVYYILALVLCCFGTLIYNKTSKIKVERSVNVTYSFNDDIKKLSSRIETLQEEVSFLFTNQKRYFLSINQLCSIYYESNSSEAYKRIIEIIKNFSKDRDLINEMEHWVNNLHNNIMKRFKANFTKFKEEDYLLFLLLVIGFSPSSIALLLDINIHVYYSRKYRIKKRLVNTDSSFCNKSDLDDFLMFLNKKD